MYFFKSRIVVTGSMDPHRPSNDPDHSPTRDHAAGALQRVARQRHDVAAAREPGAAGGPGLLHVPSQHEPHDQPSWLLASCR